MDVAIITNEYPCCNNKGGIATFTHSLAKVLISNGHNVVVFTPCSRKAHPIYYEKVLVIPKFTFLEEVFQKYFPFTIMRRVFNKYLPTTWLLILDNIQFFLTFFINRKRFKFKVLHSPVLFASAYLTSKIFSNIKTISHAQGPDELLQKFDTETFDSKLRVRIENHFMNSVSEKVVACSQSVEKYLKESHPKYKQKIIYIPNFIDATIFPKTTNTPDIKNILFLGRMEYRKGPDLVVKAFTRLVSKYSQLELKLIGEDVDGWRVDNKYTSFSNYLESLKLPEKISKKIQIISRVDERRRLVKILSQHPGVTVLPSRYEPFGFVYLESMMTGNITLASQEGGGSEIIEHNINGFLIRPTIPSIVSTIEFIHSLKTSKLVKIVKKAEKKVMTTYSFPQAKKQYQLLYKSLFEF